MTRSKAANEATRRYEAKANDVIRLLLPKGTKDRIRATGATVNGFIKAATIDKLNAMETAAQTGETTDGE